MTLTGRNLGMDDGRRSSFLRLGGRGRQDLCHRGFIFPTSHRPMLFEHLRCLFCRSKRPGNGSCSICFRVIAIVDIECFVGILFDYDVFIVGIKGVCDQAVPVVDGYLCKFLIREVDETIKIKAFQFVLD